MKRFFFIAILLLSSLPLSAQWKKILDDGEKIAAFGVAPSPHWLFGSFPGYFTTLNEWKEGRLLAYNLSTNKWGGSDDGISFGEGDIASFATLGRYFYAANNRFYRSSSNGSSWELLEAGGPLGSNGIYLFGSGGFVYRSADSGITWTQTTCPDAFAFGSIGPIVLASTAKDVRRSTDNGETWATVSYPPLGFPSTFAVIDSLIFAARDAGPAGIAYSADSGATWQTLGGFSHPVKALATDGTNLFAGTLDSGVWLSTDKGANWRDVNDGAQGLGDKLKVNALVVMDTLLFVNSTRLPEDREKKPWFNAMRSIPEMTNQGAVGKQPPPGDVISIYPNPTTGIVTVVAEEILEVSALNILGEPAIAARAHGTTSELRLDMSKLPTGTYFLKITTKRGVTVRKVVRE